MAAPPTTPVTGSVTLPDGSAFTSGVLIMRLTAPETYPGGAIPAYEARATLSGINIPSGFEVFPNAGNLRGTTYDAILSCMISGVSGVSVRREFVLATGISVGSAATYTISDLIDGATTTLDIDMGLIADEADTLLDFGGIA